MTPPPTPTSAEMYTTSDDALAAPRRCSAPAPRPSSRPRHLLLDDAGFGEPVDEGLDRAPVESQLGGQGRPGARPADVQQAEQGRAVVPAHLVRSSNGRAGHGLDHPMLVQRA